MIEAINLSIEPDLPVKEPSPSSTSDLVGKLAFYSFVCMSCFLTMGANRRRRIITQQTSGLPQMSPMIQATLEAQPPVPYEQLRCNDSDRQLVYDVISPLGTTTALGLWSREEELNNMGIELRKRIHPFKFLETIFLHPELRKTVQDIFGSTGFISKKKQEGFIDGVEWGMNEYGKKNKVFCYVDNFSQRLGVSTDEVRAHIERAFQCSDREAQRENWGNLMRCLCLRSAPLTAQLIRV